MNLRDESSQFHLILDLQKKKIKKNLKIVYCSNSETTEKKK
ncbi:7089_t:CDS:2 [Cetraspora pellucida]|uniref:7089_t:CDS:1 n=1 Tax=Cetraspora pellucida TaxID=1433469 RepID=A0ACA9MVQ8_9GLOM|nr:7089_t:CDS:2 [Cetraspora pellucida]